MSREGGEHELDAFRNSYPEFWGDELLPFFRRAYRSQPATLQLFAMGMLVGLGLVAVETFIERTLFPGAFEIFSRYPSAALFAGMNVGGGVWVAKKIGEGRERTAVVTHRDGRPLS